MTEKAQAELNARFIQGAITIRGRSDNGAWHRAIEVARRFVAYGLWDGESRIEFDAYALHDKLFGVAQTSPLALVEGKDYRFPDKRNPAKLGPNWPNLITRRTSIIDGQTRYEIAWSGPDDEAMASLYVHPDRARIELVGGSVVADGEGDSARTAYRAADRDLRLFPQDPADLLRKVAFRDEQVRQRDALIESLRAEIGRLQDEQTSLVLNFKDLQRQAAHDAENSKSVINRLNRLLQEERKRWTPDPAEAVVVVVLDHEADTQTDATTQIADLLLSGWRVEQMSSTATRTVVLMVNPNARFARSRPRRPVEEAAQ